jgi:hypothetical protein
MAETASKIELRMDPEPTTRENGQKKRKPVSFSSLFALFLTKLTTQFTQSARLDRDVGKG